MDFREDIFDIEEDFDSSQVGDEVAFEDEQQEMFEHYRFDIAAGQVPMRVDKYLATHMEYTSRHRIQLAIKAEYIRVNEKIVKANAKNFYAKVEKVLFYKNASELEGVTL